MVAEELLPEDERFSIACPVLLTERLVMRPPHVDDVDDLVALANNRKVADMLARMPHPYGVSDARMFIDRAAQGGEAVYALTLAENGQFVGAAGLHHGDYGLELGYWLGEPYWNKGYATEAAHALVDHAFRASRVNALHVSCRVINPASRRVVHKCGFQYAGQGMIDSLSAGRAPVERNRLDRKTWVSLRTWRNG